MSRNNSTIFAPLTKLTEDEIMMKDAGEFKKNPLQIAFTQHD